VVQDEQDTVGRNREDVDRPRYLTRFAIGIFVGVWLIGIGFDQVWPPSLDIVKATLTP